MLRSKLFINIAIVLVCGTVAISLPIIVNHLQKPANADIYATDWELVSVFVGDRYQDKVDTTAIWQIEQRHGNRVIHTWDEIYAAICADESLISYHHDELKLTRYGFCQIKTTAHFQAVVTYLNQSCLLQ